MVKEERQSEAPERGKTGEGPGLEDFEFQESEDLKRLKAVMEQVNFKVAVVGGKSGVGVSTITANLALALAEGIPQDPEEGPAEGLKIGLLELDLIDGPSIPGMLGLKDPVMEVAGDRLIPPTGPSGIKVVSPDMLLGNLLRPGREIGEDWLALREVLSKVDWGRLDILLIDLPYYIDELPDPSYLLPYVDASIIVSSAAEEAPPLIKRVWRFSDHMNIPVIGLVLNMRGTFNNEEVNELARRFGIPICIDIPFEPKLSAVQVGRIPHILGNKETRVGRAFFELSQELVEYLFWLHDEHDDEEVF